MKPTSIISLIIAVLLTIIGLVTCFIAQNMARSSGEQLFADRAEGGTSITKEFDPKDLEKISITFSSGAVNIYGNCDDRGSEHYSSSCKMEIVNIPATDFSFNTTNSKLEFNEMLALDRLKFWENGFSFPGMRYILNMEQIRALFSKEKPEARNDKQINLYLTREAVKALEEEAEAADTAEEGEAETQNKTTWKLNQIQITTTDPAGCNVTIRDVQIDADYNIYAAKYGLNVRNVTTNTAIHATSVERTANSDIPKTGTVTIEDSSLGYLSLSAEELDFTSVGLRFLVESESTENMKLNCSGGKIRIGMADYLAGNFNLGFGIRSTGRIFANNEDVSSPYNHDFNSGSGNPLYRVSAEAGSADVKIIIDGSRFAEEADAEEDSGE